MKNVLCNFCNGSIRFVDYHPSVDRGRRSSLMAAFSYGVTPLTQGPIRLRVGVRRRQVWPRSRIFIIWIPTVSCVNCI